MVFTLIYYLRFCDSQDTDCLTSRSDLSRFGCYKGGIHWLAMRSPPKQPNSNILVHVLYMYMSCVHTHVMYYRHCVEPLPAILRLRARWFALPKRRKGKTLRFVSPPFIPCASYRLGSSYMCTLSTPVQALGAEYAADTPS